MTVPSLRVTSDSPLTLDVDVLVIGVRKTDDGPRLLTDSAEVLALEGSLAAIGVTGGQDEVRRIPAIDGAPRSIALVGVGSVIGANELRYASGSAARQLRGAESIGFALPAESAAELLAILEGAAIGAYAYNEHRSETPDAAKLPAAELVFVSSNADADELVARAAVVATAMHSVRDLVNAPSSHLYPETFAAAALELADGAPVEVEVLDEDALRAGEFGGILGVGQGSARPPRLVKVSYKPVEADRHIALVGKGITFDTGGISLKPPVSMVGMKYDMTGAATVLAVVLAAARLGLNIRMTAWLCIAENMPSGTAIKPNDVLRIRGGKTVEVLNTDAEGRIVLADGLVAASEERPDYLIDVATLTGAQRVALGDRYSAAMGDTALVTQISDVATRVGETIWPMPLPGELRAVLASDVADIANAKPGNTAAGMLLAGVFLSEFVGSVGEGDDKRRIPWAHLDIAGPANNNGAGFGFVGKGPTGVTVRALIALAEELSVA
jgi:leucyl aminopeptidase